MKIIFFGLGSIGLRHARLIQKNFKHSLAAFRSKVDGPLNKLAIEELFSWKEVARFKPDVAFITNPTSLHIDTAIKCAKLGINLFIEKPIDCKDDKLEELIRLVKINKLSSYVAYCLRFHPVIKRIKEIVEGKDYFHCRIVASSYLPNWRNRQDYRGIYSSQAKLGGGALLDLSHEIDYSYYLFGDILKMQGVSGKISNLDTDCEDYADLFLQCRKACVNLHLNFFSKNILRTIEVDFQDSDYLRGDLINNILVVCSKGKEKTFRYTIDRDFIFTEQLKYFFKNINNTKMMNNLNQAALVFKPIVNFKKSHVS